jgi:hypothetical protein
MQRISLVFISLVIMLSFGCEKSNDAASQIAGTYRAMCPPSIYGGTAVISRQSDDEVNININGTLFEHVAVSDDGTGTILLSLTTSSTTISGNIKGERLELYINAVLFLGFI